MELVIDQPLSLLGLEETLLGGQSFSWTATTESSWIGVIGKSVVELRFNKEKLEWRTDRNNPFSEKELRAYLWLDPSYDDAIDSLPWRSDPILDRCMKALPGLRILRQPMDEVLFVFLLSSVKSIPQIKEMKDLVAKKGQCDEQVVEFGGLNSCFSTLYGLRPGGYHTISALEIGGANGPGDNSDCPPLIFNQCL